MTDALDYEALILEAVRTFWRGRETAASAQQARGGQDKGERAKVTAGLHMLGFAEMIRTIAASRGLPPASVHAKKPLTTLPGYFRPAKLWDILVVHEGRLLAALEFKSHVGPSFGNNFNNRCEEALGSGLDLKVAFREGAFGDVAKPFVGYMMLLEECDATTRPVSIDEGHFPMLPEFRGTSYAQRYDLLCRRLVREELYTATALLRSPRPAVDGEVEVLELTAARELLVRLARAVGA